MVLVSYPKWVIQGINRVLWRKAKTDCYLPAREVH